MFDLLKQKLTSKFLISILIMLSSLIWLSIAYFPDQKLHLIFCDVGQGDATLITKGKTQILIDGGPNDKVLQCLANNMPFFDRTIEVVALTHPEADHLTGLLSVLDKYQVDTFLTGPEGNNSAIFKELAAKLQSFKDSKQQSGKVAEFQSVNPYTGDTIKIGDIVLQTVWPEREWVAEKLGGSMSFQNPDEGGISGIYEDNCIDSGSEAGMTECKGAVLGAKTTAKLNQFSLVFLLKYQNHQVLLMGDADQIVQKDILLFNSLMPLEILKFPHHGSKTGMAENFLEIIKPKEAVISVGKNSYGHPTSEALDLLKSHGVTIRRTDLEGEIHYSW